MIQYEKDFIKNFKNVFPCNFNCNINVNRFFITKILFHYNYIQIMSGGIKVSNRDNPIVFFDIAVGGKEIGRLKMEVRIINGKK